MGPLRVRIALQMDTRLRFQYSIGWIYRPGPAALRN